MRRVNHHSFWQQLAAKADRGALPLRVMFELTYRCNFRCRHCYLPAGFSRRAQLPLAQVRTVLDQLSAAGCFFIGFTGGEPLLRRDFLAIVRHAAARGMQPIIYTNGSLLDSEMVRALSELPINKIDVTVPAVSEKAFGRICGVKAMKRRVFGGIERLRRFRIPFGLKVCSLADNRDEIESIRKFAAAVGAPLRIDRLLSPRLDGSRAPYEFSDRQWTDARVEPGGCVAAGALTPGEHFYCAAGKTQAAITPDGLLKLCVMINYPLLPVLKPSFSHAWKRLRCLQQKIRPGRAFPCRSCGLRQFCLWCPGRSWLFNRTFDSADPLCCDWARQAKKEALG